MQKLFVTLYEGVKDDAIAIAKKHKKEGSPDFKKLMVMLNQDRGLMVPFTKWLLGVPSKAAMKAAKEKFKEQGGDPRMIQQRGGRRRPPGPEGISDDDIEMPRFDPGFLRIQPVSLSVLENLYKQVQTLNMNNIKRDFNSFENAEEFGDYLTSELGTKQVRDALNMTTFSKNVNKNVGIVHQVKDMILDNPNIYNLFRNNLEHAGTLAEFVARKGARYKNPDDLYNAIASKLSELDDFSRNSVLEKIKKFSLKGHPVLEVKADHILLVYIEDVTAMANLGSQEWCIAQAEGYGFGHEKDAASKENIIKKKTATSQAASYFNNTYQLSKYKKAYILFDFSRDADDDLRKICFIVDPGGEINGGWDAKDTAISRSSYGKSAEELVLTEYPELNE